MAKNSDEKVSYNPKPPEITRNYDNFKTAGAIGQKKFAGMFYEEFLPELRGQRGIETYKEMALNDDVIGAILYAIEMLVRQVSWDVNPGGDTNADAEAAQFVRGCMDDMSQTWQDTISDILSFITYGWCYCEICYKVRNSKQKRKVLSSRYDDGLIGWSKIPIRAQDTLYRWEYDEYDDLVGMTQMVPPTSEYKTIPIEKSLHFVTKSTKGNPEGRSILRNAYRDWYFKKRMQEIEGIGVERDLAGLPVIIPPEDVNIWDESDPDMVSLLNQAENLVRNIRRDEKEGVVLPYGWTFELMNSGSRRQFEIGSIIERYDKRIASTVMADFILIGQDAVGSFSLADTKARLFTKSLMTYLDVIAQVFNTQGIPRLIDLNGEHFRGITDYPKLIHGDVDSRDAKSFIEALARAIDIGVIEIDESVTDYVRKILGLPEDVQKTSFPGQKVSQNKEKANVNPEKNKDQDANKEA